eukprot:539930_1
MSNTALLFVNPPSTKARIKDVKLRIIKNQENDTMTCCLMCCPCIDQVSRLTKQERLVLLVCGYVRENANGVIGEDVIYECVKYVGNFDHDFITTTEKRAAEIYKLNDVLQECCGCCNQAVCDCCYMCCNILAKCLTHKLCCCGFGKQCVVAIPAFVLTIAAVLVFFGVVFGLPFGKDVAGIVIYSYYDCDISGGSDYVMFNVNTWLLYGSITHLSALILSGCWMLGCVIILDDLDNDLDNDVLFWSIVLCFPCMTWCFEFAWLIIGFLLYSEMVNDSGINNSCIDMVVSWNVLQAVELVLVCCIAVCVSVLNSLNQNS